MNRRGFLGVLSGAIAGIAIEQAIPLGRVWSFPTDIVAARRNRLLTTDDICRETLRLLQERLKALGPIEVGLGTGYSPVRMYGGLPFYTVPLHDPIPWKILEARVNYLDMSGVQEIRLPQRRLGAHA